MEKKIALKALKMQMLLLIITSLSENNGKWKRPFEFSQNINAKAVSCDEVGCGVVPMDKKQILYREAVGRSCCILAERAERVTRVICGIGVIIK